MLEIQIQKYPCVLKQDALGREGATAAEQRDSLCAFVADLEHIVDVGADHFDPVNISTALHTLGSTVGDPDLSRDATSGAIISPSKIHPRILLSDGFRIPRVPPESVHSGAPLKVQQEEDN